MLEQSPLAVDETSRGVSRRMVVKSAAWTVPTVAVVVGIPEAAHASPGVFEWSVDQPTFYRMTTATGPSQTGGSTTTANFAKFIITPRSTDADGSPNSSYPLSLTVQTAAASNGVALVQANSVLGNWTQTAGPTDSTSASTSYTFTTTLAAANDSTEPITLVFGAGSGAAGWANGDSTNAGGNAKATITTSPSGTSHTAAVMTVSGAVTNASISAPAYT